MLPSTAVGLAPGGAELAPFIQACKADLEGGRILSADGEVTFDPQEILAIKAESPQTGNGYRLLAACRSAYKVHLEGRASGGFLPGYGLWPGRYRLYIAPQSNLVVGAEPLVAPRGQTQLLMAALHLTEETLAENRLGRMTKAQQQATAEAEEAPIWGLLAILAILLGGSALFQMARALEKGHTLFSTTLVVTSLLALALIVATPLQLLAQRRKAAQRKADAEEGRAASHEGIARTSHFIHRGTLRLSLRLGERDFDLSERPVLHAAIVEEHPYRAWVAPRSGRLLSLELLENGATPRAGTPSTGS